MAKETRNSKKRKSSQAVSNFPDEKGSELLHLQMAEFSIHLFLNVLFYLAVIVIIVKFGTVAYDFTYPIFGDVSVEASPGTDVNVTISKGESVDTLIQDLEDKQLILNPKSFRIRCKLSFCETKQIVPGTYVLNTSMNYAEIINVITNTEEVEE